MSLEPDSLSAPEFYEQVMQPGFPNEMVLSLYNENPDNPNSFSEEGFNDVTDKIHDFIVARTLGHWYETGEPPKRVGISITLVWGDEVEGKDELADGYRPYYFGQDRGMGRTQD